MNCICTFSKTTFIFFITALLVVKASIVSHSFDIALSNNEEIKNQSPQISINIPNLSTKKTARHKRQNESKAGTEHEFEAEELEQFELLSRQLNSKNKIQSRSFLSIIPSHLFDHYKSSFSPRLLRPPILS